MASTSPARIDDDLYASAKLAGTVQSRSASQQVVHWARIGREIEASASVSAKEIGEVLAGARSYDSLDAKEQAVVARRVGGPYGRPARRPGSGWVVPRGGTDLGRVGRRRQCRRTGPPQAGQAPERAARPAKPKAAAARGAKKQGAATRGAAVVKKAAAKKAAPKRRAAG